MGDDDHQVVRYGAPEAREDWVTMFGALAGVLIEDREFIVSVTNVIDNLPTLEG